VLEDTFAVLASSGGIERMRISHLSPQSDGLGCGFRFAATQAVPTIASSSEDGVSRRLHFELHEIQIGNSADFGTEINFDPSFWCPEPPEAARRPFCVPTAFWYQHPASGDC
jgi:hypothetical protein